MAQKKNRKIMREKACFLVLQKINYLSDDLFDLVKEGKDEIFVSGSKEEQVEFLENLVDGITKVIQKLGSLRHEALETRVKIEEELKNQ